MHPFRSDVRRTMVGKMRSMATAPSKEAGPGAPEWNEYSPTSTSLRGNRYGYPLGENEPAFDASENSRPINRDPKAFRP